MFQNNIYVHIFLSEVLFKRAKKGKFLVEGGKKNSYGPVSQIFLRKLYNPSKKNIILNHKTPESTEENSLKKCNNVIIIDMFVRPNPVK